MIIEKTYDFNTIPSGYTHYTIRDYHRTIITNIMKNCYEIMKSTNNNTQPIVFIGAECYNILEDQSYFISKADSVPITENIHSIGSIMGRITYYDNRLEINKVVIGDSISEINYHILTKGRKEKLEKLNGIIN